MKRKFVVLIILVLCLLIGYENSKKDNLIYALEENQYIFKPQTCKNFFGCNPAEASDVLKNSYWVQGHYQSAVEDEMGNFVLTLSEEDKEHWRNYISQLIQKRSELDASEGYQFLVSNDYKSIESHTTREVYLAAGFNIIDISAFCGLMQMLNGEDINNWYVDVKMVDLDTGIVIAEAKIPKETVKVNDEDWDRALNNAEGNSTNGQ